MNSFKLLTHSSHRTMAAFYETLELCPHLSGNTPGCIRMIYVRFAFSWRKWPVRSNASALTGHATGQTHDKFAIIAGAGSLADAILTREANYFRLGGGRSRSSRVDMGVNSSWWAELLLKINHREMVAPTSCHRFAPATCAAYVRRRIGDYRARRRRVTKHQTVVKSMARAGLIVVEWEVSNAGW